MKSSINFRIKAFLLHICISVVIASIVVAIVFFIWHPFPLAKAIGVTHIFFMLIAIDVILGPMLTLIIANNNKKSLKNDLVIIAVLQFLALAYGVHNIAMARPVYIAFDLLRFELVQANNISKEDKTRARYPYSRSDYFLPQWVAVIPAKNNIESNERTFDELRTGVAPSMRPTLYEPLNKQWHTIVQKSIPLSELYKYNSKEAVQKVLSNHPDSKGYLPLKASMLDMVVLIDNNKVIKVVDLRPWK